MTAVFMPPSSTRSVSLEQLGLVRELEEFLYFEAELADAHQFDAWSALWTTELRYWVPCNSDNIDPQRQVSLIFDDRPRLEERLFRLKTKHAHSQNPRSRLSRVVSNVRLHDFDPEKGGVISSRFNLSEVRLDRLTVWAGRQHHVLERHADGWRIREKHVFLVNNDSPMGNLTFVI